MSPELAPFYPSLRIPPCYHVVIEKVFAEVWGGSPHPPEANRVWGGVPGDQGIESTVRGLGGKPPQAKLFLLFLNIRG